MVSDESLDLDEDNHIYFQMDISNVSRNVNGEGGQNNGSENIQSVETFESFKSNNVPQSEVNVSSGTSNCENENDKLKQPYMGMLFDSIEGATTYYEEYGRQNGFSVRRRSSQRTHTRVDEVTSIKFVCSREGKPNRRNENSLNEETSRSCSTIKRECGAAMRILYRKQLLKWSVSKFSDEHNHKLISPIKRVHMRTNRVFPDAAKDLTEKFHQENIPLSKVPSMLGGSEIGFDTRDCYNFLRTNRLKDLEEGDASSVLTYFQRKIRENPQFFYNVQVDVVTGRAVNFFWVDARSRMTYQQFGDVVTFDTTYRTNKYKMPFDPFTGVNHHFQSIQFGCALLQDETEISFLWLFTTWLEAMGGRAPKSFITDQCATMCAAVRKIFPNTRHRLCLWHIKMKFPEKLSHIYLTNVDFKNRFEKCIHHTYHIEEFEKTWENLVSEFGLENNEWLQGLFDIRESWVPVYHRNTFYAGMNTTSRSEGVNAFFGDFVSSNTNLRQFVVRYEQALKNIVRKEIDEDYISEHKDRIVSKRDLLLKHASNIYTRNMFDKFREELQKADSYRASDPVRDGVFDKYLVKCKFGAQRDFLVKWNSETHEGFCECSHFQFTGILCKHLLKIFVRLDVDEIPQHFILKRWTKGANSFRVMDEQEIQGTEKCSKTYMLSHLCRISTQMCCIASEDEHLYKKALDGIKKVMTDILEERDRKNKIDALVEVSNGSPEPQEINVSCPIVIQDPHISQTLGKPRDDKRKGKQNDTRWKRPIEIALGGSKRKCTLCKETGHNRITCTKRQNLTQTSQSEPSGNEELVEAMEYE